jgi:hypothetical protein
MGGLFKLGIAYSLKDYCELVDTTGRCIRGNKTGYIKTGYIDKSQSLRDPHE